MANWNIILENAEKLQADIDKARETLEAHRGGIQLHSTSGETLELGLLQGLTDIRATYQAGLVTLEKARAAYQTVQTALWSLYSR